MRSSEDELQPLAAQPGDGDVRLVIPGGDQQRIVGTLLEPHYDLFVRDLHTGRGVDEVAEQMPRLSDLVAVAEAACQESVEAAGHQGQLQVAVDLHRYRRAQRV